jgi:hypothetical protein
MMMPLPFVKPVTNCWILLFDSRSSRAHSLFSNRAASFSAWRFSKKPLHGSDRANRGEQFPKLKSAGASAGVTSDQSSGVEMGALSRRRTE